jgi:Fic family protein
MQASDAEWRPEFAVETLRAAIAAKKADLDQLRIRAPGGTTNFDHAQDLELTYTSNAIEGNTLTAVETTMVIEQGITVAGKPLKDHLEAIDHFDAIRYVRKLARHTVPLTRDGRAQSAPFGDAAINARLRRPLRRSRPLCAD